MIVKYVLDACALIAFLYDEDGADKVQKVFEDAYEGTSVPSTDKSKELTLNPCLAK